ncbi:MAG: ACT domain-containing protein [Anaerolineales bacterium]
MLTSDENASRTKLEELGLPFEEQEILTVTMPDRPGQLGDFAEMLGEADINIETIFVIDTASGFTELAIGVDKIEEAKALPLGQF